MLLVRDSRVMLWCPTVDSIVSYRPFIRAMTASRMAVASSLDAALMLMESNRVELSPQTLTSSRMYRSSMLNCSAMAEIASWLVNREVYALRTELV